MNLQGLQLRQRSFVPATERTLGTRNDRVQSISFQKQWKPLAARPAGRLSSRSSTVVRFSHSSNNDPVSKSVFSFNILDILGFIFRIPTFLIGFINKEKKIIDQIEDRLEDAAETVGDVAEVIEKVAGVVEQVAERIADDARETRELMDKVEATADSMRSDINTAIDNLQEAAEAKQALADGDTSAPEKLKGAADAAAEASSRASEKVGQVKEAAVELEAKGKSQAKFQAVTIKRPMFWSVFLASFVVLLTGLWFPQLPYIVKLISQFIVPGIL